MVACVMPTLWTIGHSTRPADQFRALLLAQDIRLLVDVRRYPGSRRYPHFSREQLAKDLAEGGIAYAHRPDLGGRRAARADSLNVGWKNASFRGYADYMEGIEFQQALDALLDDSRRQHTVVMCAEAVPWRCHRMLIADAAWARRWDVRHILDAGPPHPHVLTAFARCEGERVSYPAPSNRDQQSSLPYRES